MKGIIMSEFQKFVSYIHLYEENRKIRNLGFAKIEKRGGQCKIEIHMKGTGYTGISCPVYLFVRRDDRMVGISLGKMQIMSGSGAGRFLLDGDNINQSGYGLKDIGGFLIFVSEKVMFASQWDDQEMIREQFVLLEEMQPSEPEEAEQEESAPEPPTVKATEAAAMRQRVVTPITPHLEKEEVPWEQKWPLILENYPVLTPFEGEEDILCIRMELKDLRLLPKHYWYLGNNSFLLHGFFNYRYLVLGMQQQEEQVQWFLGIPGVFQSQEKVMASIFGFPEYKSEKAVRQKTGQFGYWYRYLEL